MTTPVTERPLRIDLLRGPPCERCGMVDPAYGYRPDNFRHICNPTAVQAKQIGIPNVERIGQAINDAFRTLRANHE